MKSGKGLNPLREPPVQFSKPPKPLPEIAAELAELKANRPSNLDNPAITKHASECARLRFWLEVNGWTA